MSQRDWFVLMGMGGVFILLGLGAIIWGRTEEKRYYNSLTARSDAREFLEHWPPRLEPAALKIGGWIAIAIGLFMLILGVFFITIQPV
ncbi:MAG: hypothetical protein PHN78_01070 [Dehalococcoidales bacterium]|nr:hypothetical protein [Dehalococcoidales bacterium]